MTRAHNTPCFQQIRVYNLHDYISLIRWYQRRERSPARGARVYCARCYTGPEWLGAWNSTGLADCDGREERHAAGLGHSSLGISTSWNLLNAIKGD